MFFRDVRPIRKNLDYNETQVSGHYTTFLRKISRSYFGRRKVSAAGRRQPSDDCCFSEVLPTGCQNAFERLRFGWLTIYEWFGGEWILLTALGVVVAIFSFIMDVIMEKCNTARMLMFDLLSFSVLCQYFMWILFSVSLICFATGFTHFVGPYAVGSGIPEVKTIMRGVPLNEYLTLNTLIAKVVGLSTALGSGLPIGKEGPFVHVASISAAVLSRFFSCFRKQNESKNAEILAAACAVGVACTFAAPVGGVLFSIEVTATYFAVKNYWRGFYSAFIGAIMFRFLAIWFQEEVTLTAYFRTNLARGTFLAPGEILTFSAVGMICGFGGVLFIFAHKRVVLFVRNNKIFKTLIRKNRLIYPSLVTLLVLSLFFPPGFGQFMGGMLTNPEAVRQLFNNNTWSNGIAANYEEELLLNSWRSPLNNCFVTLTFFVFVRFWMCAIATTLPIPAGIFIPSFTLGAGCGRLIGEILAVWFPSGICGNPVLPGGYAIVGAAAFAGSVTHTVSTVVIAFEMTGQIGHVLPCIVAVLLACFISMKLTPSIFDVIVEIKKLPFLPGSISSTDNVRNLIARDFMIRNVEFVTECTTYKELDEMLERNPYRTFPLLKSKENRLLLGSIHRHELERILEKQLSLDSKIEYFKTRTNSAASATENKRLSEPVLIQSQLQQDCLLEEHAEFRIEEDELKQQDRIENSALLEDFEKKEEDWLEYQMSQTIDLRSCLLDPAPFQLNSKTSLFKVHSMFSLLSLHHAFVTKDGRLIGIISVNEVRSALEHEMNTNEWCAFCEKGQNSNQA